MSPIWRNHSWQGIDDALRATRASRHRRRPPAPTPPTPQIATRRGRISVISREQKLKIVGVADLDPRACVSNPRQGFLAAEAGPKAFRDAAHRPA